MNGENNYWNGNLANNAEQSYTTPSENTYRANTGNTGNTSSQYGSQQSGDTNGNGNMNTNFNGSYNGSGHNGGKKKGGFFKKVAVIVASALLFGCVAGGTMVGVSRLAAKNAPAVSSTKESTAPSITKSAANNDSTAKNSTSASGSTGSASSNLDVSATVEKAMPSVVAITGTSEVQQSNIFGQTQSYEAHSAGSGIIIGENDTELLVVTNNHVVEGISKDMKATFIDNSSVDAVVKGTDTESDIAVIAIKKSDISSDTMSKISIASIGDSDNLKVGQGVIAIGNAMGYGQSVTVGYVSALNRTIEARDSSTNETVKTQNLVQTDAAINPGNSGGALLDMNGNVIGINESKAVDTEVEGMGYAIPISKVQNIISTLSSQKTRTVVDDDKQGSIGIQGQNIDAEMSQTYDIPKGIYVYKIISGSAAASSDLQEKDVITKIDGQSILTMAELKEKLKYYATGEDVTLTVQRLNGSKYEEKEITLTLGSREALESQAGADAKNNAGSDSGNSGRNGNGKGSGNGSNNSSETEDDSQNSKDNSGGLNKSWSFSFPW